MKPRTKFNFRKTKFYLKFRNYYESNFKLKPKFGARVKKIIFISQILLTAFLLAGCSLTSSNTSSADGGVFKSVDSGETWTQKVLISQTSKGTSTIASVSTSLLVFDPKDKNKIYLSTKGNGIFKTENGGDSWQQTTLNAGEYVSIAIDPHNTDVIYVARGNTIQKSIDGMGTWQTIYVETRPGQSITSVVVDLSDNSKIYATTNTGILKSFDYGNTWQVLKWVGNNANKLYMSEKDTNTIYLVTTNAGIFKTTDAGENWQDISQGLQKYPGAKNIKWFYFIPQTELIYLGTDYAPIKSEDGGKTWTPIATLLPFGSLPIQTVAVNPKNNREIFFTVSNTIYKSVDGGQTWKTLKTVNTNRIINYFLINPESPNIIYLGTLKQTK